MSIKCPWDMYSGNELEGREAKERFGDYDDEGDEDDN